jgi:hypothetical protein
MSYRFDHPSLDFRRLGAGVLVAIVPERHPLAGLAEVSTRRLAEEPLIGVDDSDPYGAITAEPFRMVGAERRLSIRARFAQTVVSLVSHGLGVAFSVAGAEMPGLVRLPLQEKVELAVYAAQNASRAVELRGIHHRAAARRAAARHPWPAPGRAGGRSLKRG